MRLLLAILVVGLLADGFLLVQRVGQERASRSVGLVVDWADIQALATSTGLGESSVLAACAQSGVWGVAITEQTLGDLQQSGELTLLSTSWANGQGTILRFESARKAKLARRVLKTQRARPAATTDPREIQILAPWAGLKSLGIGFDETTVALVRRSGLSRVARPVAYPAVNPERIEALISELATWPCQLVLFAGTEVLGNPGLLELTRQQLLDHQIKFGLVEFFKQQGSSKLGMQEPDLAVRVHSISEQELAPMTSQEAIDRFLRAVTERGIRACYVRLLPGAQNDPLTEAISPVQTLADKLRQAGFALGEPSTLDYLWRPFWAVLLAAAGVAAGCMLLWLRLARGALAPTLVLTGLVFIAVIGLAALGGAGLKLVGLLSAIVFPTLGYLLFVPWQEETPEPRPLRAAVLGLAGFSVVSLVGGVFIAGLLAEPALMLHLDQFTGVKLAQLLPLALITALLVGGFSPAASGPRAELAALVVGWKRALSEPSRIVHLLAGFALLALVAVWMLRTGNEGMGVSGTELKLRTLLENLLGARPRTKEFLFAHPALLLGLYLGALRYWKLAVPLTLLGLIGQVSLVNTFCHLHTPFVYSVLRSFNGLWIGLVIGLILIALVRPLLRRTDG